MLLFMQKKEKHVLLMIICTILVSPILFRIEHWDLGILALIPYLLIYFVLYVVWILKELLKNYGLNWTSVIIIFVLFLLFLGAGYFRIQPICPLENSLHDRISGRCYSCNEQGYFYADNCSICSNRIEIDGKCYLK